MIPTTYTVIAMRDNELFSVQLEGRDAFKESERVEAEAFAVQFQKEPGIQLVFLMKHSCFRVYGVKPGQHPENKPEKKSP